MHKGEAMRNVQGNRESRPASWVRHLRMLRPSIKIGQRFPISRPYPATILRKIHEGE